MIYRAVIKASHGPSVFRVRIYKICIINLISIRVYSTTMWTIFYPILTPTPLEWTSVDILHSPLKIKALLPANFYTLCFDQIFSTYIRFFKLRKCSGVSLCGRKSSAQFLKSLGGLFAHTRPI